MPEKLNPPQFDREIAEAVLRDFLAHLILNRHNFIDIVVLAEQANQYLKTKPD